MKIKLFSRKTKPDIPTSSFADVAFLLLVFFILTTVIAISKGIGYSVPKQSEETESYIPGIYIYISDRGNVFIDGREATPQGIKQYCREKITINPNKPVIIHCDPDQQYQGFITILDKIKQLENELYQTYNKNRPLTEQKRIHIVIPSSEEGVRYGLMISRNKKSGL
ncbi:MAG: biopolymer transporter ExbD [Acidobacteria bacterium]|nr:biopolymer transporter ExbD [Acidobacteriota bacterium]